MIDSEIGFSIEHFQFIQSRTLRRDNPDRCTSIFYGCSKNEFKLENELVDYEKLKNWNVVNQLIRRETGLGKHNVSSHYAVRNFHKNIVPNYSLPQIRVPNECFLKKFSLDGKYLIGFYETLKSVEIYEYQGPSAGESLLRTMSAKNPSLFISELKQVRQEIFSKMFPLKHRVEVVTEFYEYLHRECLLFTEDHKYMIVASVGNVDIRRFESHFNTYRNNESLSPFPIGFLENYTLYIIDIKNGIVCDTRCFKSDKIYLSHNQGLYLYHDYLTVMSVMHQTIHVYKITQEGTFAKIRCIGRFCQNDDIDTYLASNPMYPEQELSGYHPYQEAFLTTMKQKLMVFLYRRFAHASHASLDEGSDEPLKDFYHQFDKYLSLKMWKIQMLDKEHLLIKYSTKSGILLRNTNLGTTPSPVFFAVYNMVTSEILDFYEGDSEELLQMYDTFPDHFRNVALHAPGQLSCSVSHPVHATFLQNRLQMTHKRLSVPEDAFRYLLKELPISSQCHSASPYLDSSLFKYDTCFVSTFDKFIPFQNQAIKFYDRDSGLLLYEINTKCQCKSVPGPCKREIKFIFHPSDPLIISVQKSNYVMVVNLHLRHLFL